MAWIENVYYYDMQMMCKLNIEVCAYFNVRKFGLPGLYFEIDLLWFSGMHITVASMSRFAEGIMSTFVKLLTQIKINLCSQYRPYRTQLTS